jgi:hypothetical protein
MAWILDALFHYSEGSAGPPLKNVMSAETMQKARFSQPRGQRKVNDENVCMLGNQGGVRWQANLGELVK